MKNGEKWVLVSLHVRMIYAFIANWNRKLLTTWLFMYNVVLMAYQIPCARITPVVAYLRVVAM